MKLCLLALPAAIGLASCAATYAPPASGPVARLEVTAPAAGTYYVVLDDSCESRHPLAKEQLSGVSVPAGRQVAVEFWLRRETETGSSWCNGALAFTSQENATYVVSLAPSIDTAFLTGCHFSGKGASATGEPLERMRFVRAKACLK